MDSALLLTLVAAFVAVVLALEGLYLFWADRFGPEAKRLKNRIDRASGVSQKTAGAALWRVRKQQTEGLNALMVRIWPPLGSVGRLVEQSGSDASVDRVLLLVLGLFGGTALGLTATGMLLPAALAVALAAGSIPLLVLAYKRQRRVSSIEAQLPDAIELIVRALRAGHALPAAIQMAADELPEPISVEFRIVSDELSFGVGADEALRGLAARIPSDDIRFFAIAVLLQRETGGNLGEVLSNIARLVRDRLKLLGKVRVLAAEGKLSAWILAAMPLVLAAIIHLVNPGFLSVLWTTSTGTKLLQACGVLYAIGGLWMVKIIKIKV